MNPTHNSPVISTPPTRTTTTAATAALVTGSYSVLKYADVCNFIIPSPTNVKRLTLIMVRKTASAI